MAQKIDHLQNGDELFRFTPETIKHIKDYGVHEFQLICCDCDKEDVVLSRLEGKDIVGRVYRDDTATAFNRKKKK